MNAQHQRWLTELTGLPTASGCEQRVIEWVKRWASRRSRLSLKRDRAGNVMIQRRGARSASPMVMVAHMDHPAFVVREVIDAYHVETDFRGGVQDSFFVTGRPRVILHHARGTTGGWVEAFRPALGETLKGARIELEKPVQANVGDAVTWALGVPRIDAKKEMLHAPVCDNLGGVAAGLAAMDVLSRSRSRKQADVRLLLTRSEEVGFIGAIAACRNGFIPARARIIVLECSKSYADSPIGGGPIVRVGDRTSTFDPDLTYRIAEVAADLARRDETFAFQRKLMPGGTCEASAFQSYGFTAACICLPLGNYHNMNDATGMIDAESISLRDFAQMVRLLAELGKRLDNPAQSPSLRTRLEKLFAARQHILLENRRS